MDCTFASPAGFWLDAMRKTPARWKVLQARLGGLEFWWA